MDWTLARFDLTWRGFLVKLERMLRRTTVLLRRTTTVLSGVPDCGFILLGGACHGGKSWAR